MKLHELREAEGTKRNRKRRGRGPAAGQGKTGGFGTKGDGARSGRGGNLYFEGGQLPLVNRLPHRRGFRNINRVSYAGVNVCELNYFVAGTVVDPELLREVGLVRSPKSGQKPVKLLGDGKLDRPLTIRGCSLTETAREKILAAGGTCEE
jgi:large subunit ribosomal protein L15